ncbi:helix-turn-helix domain-containing protein [Paraburkholderia sp. SARCC-3016]|uniref:PucR family transcriptional regulator n=1 Tax=Paraburkholderia sp. SARCC-3016 TaxID=3058611 RepID=UPI00280871E6|nr:helix-turn-helix domain-containing protein [Paraburkholderia sp. SARCC-3016]MDQ7980962.1 helix-turn-helix domain-containing protein [Paraburkholderia sp. SARCC-3016]
MPDPPEISSELRNNISALYEEPGYLIDHCYATVMSVEGYEKLGLSERKDVYDSLCLVVRRWCSQVLGCDHTLSDEIEQFEAAIRRRVHQGISLVSVLCAFRLGVKELWLAHLGLAEHERALREELLFAISPYLYEYADFMTDLIRRIFIDEQFQHTRWRAEMRRQLFELVFTGGLDEQDFDRIARSLSVDPTLPRVALAIDWELIDASRSSPEDTIERLALNLGGAVNVEAEHVVHGMRHGRLIAWIPCARGDSLIFNQRALLGSIVEFANRTSGVRRVGVGLMNRGPKGWAASADEATSALDVALRSSDATKVLPYADIAIDESIRANRNALRYFEAVLGEILRERDLLKTLECYFDSRQHRKKTAATLGIHPNTLNYRLERIEALLGAELDAPAWITRIFVALNLRNAAAANLGEQIEDQTSGVAK